MFIQHSCFWLSSLGFFLRGVAQVYCSRTRSSAIRIIADRMLNNLAAPAASDRAPICGCSMGRHFRVNCPCERCPLPSDGGPSCRVCDTSGRAHFVSQMHKKKIAAFKLARRSTMMARGLYLLIMRMVRVNMFHTVNFVLCGPRPRT